MTRTELMQMLAEGLSLEEMGERVGRHPSTVSYWLRKRGLGPNGIIHAPRGPIARQRLVELVERGMTLAEIGAEVDRSPSSVRYWITKYGLSRPDQVRRSQIEAAFAEGRRSIVRRCATHGWTEFVIERSGRSRCRRCRVERVSAWRRRVKARLVAEAGGSCVVCGYDRCQAALQFHHLDPGEKAFHLSNEGVPRSLAALRAEAAKCVLLCANCHAEVEAGFTRIAA